MLSLCLGYSAGLRVSELIGLTIGDIDNCRMVTRVEQGKGRKDCYTVPWPQFLPVLRQRYLKAEKPNDRLFPSLVVDELPLFVNVVR
ncbi:MAG: tyrosine-type recombinase/integrase [Telmatospirillum sp.]|nr:tyrosine-type recombinase/integrase [Telmatospirillum sp.]